MEQIESNANIIGKAYDIIEGDEGSSSFMLLSKVAAFKSFENQSQPENRSTRVTFSGDTFEDYKEQFSNETELSVDGGTFQGSLKIAYKKLSTKTSSHSYMSLLDIHPMKRLYISVSELKKNLSDQFISDTKNDKMTPEQIINKYGSHFLTDVLTGGRITITSYTEGESTLSSSELSATVSAAYGVYSAHSTTNKGKEYKSKLKNAHTTVVTEGGDAENRPTEFNYENLGTDYIEWKNSLKNNSVLIKINKNGLTPIWELVENKQLSKELEDAFNIQANQYQYGKGTTIEEFYYIIRVASNSSAGLDHEGAISFEVKNSSNKSTTYDYNTNMITVDSNHSQLITDKPYHPSNTYLIRVSSSNLPEDYRTLNSRFYIHSKSKYELDLDFVSVLAKSTRGNWHILGLYNGNIAKLVSPNSKSLALSDDLIKHRENPIVNNRVSKLVVSCITMSDDDSKYSAMDAGVGIKVKTNLNNDEYKYPLESTRNREFERSRGDTFIIDINEEIDFYEINDLELYATDHTSSDDWYCRDVIVMAIVGHGDCVPLSVSINNPFWLGAKPSHGKKSNPTKALPLCSF